MKTPSKKVAQAETKQRRYKSLNLKPELHSKVKAAAARRGISMDQFVHKSLSSEIEKDDYEQLKSLLGKQGSALQPVSKT